MKTLCKQCLIIWYVLLKILNFWDSKFYLSIDLDDNNFSFIIFWFYLISAIFQYNMNKIKNVCLFFHSFPLTLKKFHWNCNLIIKNTMFLVNKIFIEKFYIVFYIYIELIRMYKFLYDEFWSINMIIARIFKRIRIEIHVLKLYIILLISYFR